MSDEYKHFSRDELLNEIARLKKDHKKIETKPYSFDLQHNQKLSIRETIKDVLSLLLHENNIHLTTEILSLIRNHFDIDRVFIGIFDHNSESLKITHNQCIPNLKSERIPFFENLKFESIPWSYKQLQNKQAIILNSVDTLPKECNFFEKQLMEIEKVQSFLGIPLLRNNKTYGMLGLDFVFCEHYWTKDEIHDAELLTNLLSIAMDREQDKNTIEHSAKEILKNEAKFRLIFERLPLGIELYDEKGYLLDLNKADLDIWGAEYSNILGINLFENPNLPDSLRYKLSLGEDVTMSFNYDFRKVKTSHYYKTAVTKDIKHIHVNGIPLKDQQNIIFGYLFIISDITDEFNKAEQLQYNLVKLKAAINTGESILWDYDISTNHYSIDLSMNQDSSSDFSISRLKKYLPTTMEEYFCNIHPNDVPKLKAQFKRLYSGKTDSFQASYRRIMDNRTFWFKSNIRTYKFNDDGTPCKIVCHSANITKERENEVELIRIKEADKLKSAFLANMSHEIRTPLNAIVGFSEIITECEDKEEQKEFLNIIRSNNRLLLNLINDILDFSKIESNQLEYHLSKIDIKEICNNVYASSSLKIKPGVDLIFDNSLPEVYLKTDPQRINQVLSNFINNAIKFTEKGSICIGYKVEPKHLFVFVSDTGIGIKESDCSRIFDRFIKLNEFKQGTGLGLTICKTIIENLGGTIGVESEEGKGSTFWFELPL